MKMAVCSAGNLFVILLCTQLVSAQLPADQVSSMTSIYEIIRNDTMQDDHSSSFVWRNVWKYSDPCSWRGVGCSPDNSSINTISLQHFSISTSEFLPFLCNISTLESLDVSYNRLSSIPDGFFTGCGVISGLKLLNFAWNRLNGSLPTFNNRFRVLENLDFSMNSLSGEISLQLNELDSLKSVDLGRNNFSGKIPTNLGRMNLLENLVLSANNFTGEIPIEITKYKNLSLIYLSGNQLSGSIPKEFGELTKLKTLNLSNNNLIGGIPASLSNITTLESFAANENKFNGTILLGITSNLAYLNLSYNSLRGIIPSDLLSGANLASLDLSFNNLEGPIPPITSTKLWRLRLGSNSLNGTIPSHSLGSHLGLMYLELDDNSLTGEIPLELGMCKNLYLLNLAKNSLRGSLPSSLANLNNLRVLNLESNKLGGPIPDSVAGISSLSELHLGNNQLNGRIPFMPESLTALNLSHNLFEGPIPSSLSTVRMRLQVLDLSNNSFSGKIPSFLTRFFVLTHLLLMNNDLSGVVPTFTDSVKVETRPGNDNLIYDIHWPTVIPHRNTTSMFNSEIAIAVASGFPVGLVISIIAIFISRKYKRIHDHLSPPSSILRSAIDLKKGMEAVSDPSNITHKARFSTFYKAVMPSGSTYLVKKINHSHTIFKFPQNREFQEELEVLGNLSHPNVMIPKAYVLTPRRAYLFYDFVRGTLHDVLHRRMGNSTLDWASRYSIAVGVAKGLAYLHECSSGPVLLLDLSTKTILLKSLVEPQISDVELCKFIHPSKSTSLFSDGYVPPENGCGERVTAAGNVYSYGVLLLELLTGKPAVSDEGAELAKWTLTFSEPKSQREQILDSSVSSGTSSVGVRSQMLAVLEVACACVSVSPDMRPNAVSVMQMLQSRRSSIINGSN